MTWEPAPPLTKFKPGQFVFIRARVLKGGHNGQEPCAVVQLVNRIGMATEEVEMYVREDQLISVGDAIKAVSEAGR